MSTIFLGIDYNLYDEGPPLLFETMAFPKNGDTPSHQRRCTTWDEALAQHEAAVALFKKD